MVVFNLNKIFTCRFFFIGLTKNCFSGFNDGFVLVNEKNNNIMIMILFSLSTDELSFRVDPLENFQSTVEDQHDFEQVDYQLE